MSNSRAKGRKCFYCPNPATIEHDLPMSPGNPYPESIWTCSNPKCVAWAKEGIDQEEQEIVEDERQRVPCQTCSGDMESGYCCVYSRLYEPGECPQITGVF